MPDSIPGPRYDSVVKTWIYCVVALMPTLDIPGVCRRVFKNTTPGISVFFLAVFESVVDYYQSINENITIRIGGLTHER